MASLNSFQPFHRQFPDKCRSQTLFGKYEKLYRRPPTVKKNSKQFIALQNEEKIKLGKVIDFSHLDRNEAHHQQNIYAVSALPNGQTMYGYRSFPDLYVIPNYLSTQLQFEWVKQSLTELSAAPYNNLTNLYTKHAAESAWKQAVHDNDFGSFRKITWSNIGICYDWTERNYNLSRVTAPIPQSMLRLCDDCNTLLAGINNAMDDEQTSTTTNKDTNDLSLSMQIKPQTAIINFFAVNTKRPMGGHRDAAELINAPLISVSLGCAAIFLISDDDNSQPLPLWLRSGDVMIMAGKARFALHCVARVVGDSCPAPLCEYFDQQISEQQTDSVTQREIKLMKQYMMQSRINFNMRQVIDEHKLPNNVVTKLTAKRTPKSDDNDHDKTFHTMHSF